MAKKILIQKSEIRSIKWLQKVVLVNHGYSSCTTAYLLVRSERFELIIINPFDKTFKGFDDSFFRIRSFYIFDDYIIILENIYFLRRFVLKVPV